MNNTENIVGFPICLDGIDQCITRIQSWLLETGGLKYFVCANPHSLVTAHVDSALNTAILEADLITPDGSGIVLASQMLGGSIKGRVTGSDIFLGLSDVLNKKGESSYFFLGSTQEVLRDIEDKLAIDYPKIRLAGSWSPPFKAEFTAHENQLMIDAINQAKPDVLWVGMTAPKQEKWVHQHRHQLNVKFVGAIGAVFDFYTGKVRRSHPIFQRMGLEWLPRLLANPKRLWRRMGVSAPIFMWRVLKQRFELKY